MGAQHPNATPSERTRRKEFLKESRSPVERFLHARLKAKTILELGEEFHDIRQQALNIQPVPQAKGSANEALTLRNKALMQFRQRACDEQLIPQKWLKDIFEQSKKVFRAYQVLRGKKAEDFSPEEIVEKVQQLVQKKETEITGEMSISLQMQAEMQRATQAFENAFRQIKDLPEQIRAANSWTQDALQLRTVQRITRPFPEELPLSKALAAEQQRQSQTEMFNPQRFSRPEEIGKGSFGTVFKARKDRQEDVALKQVDQQRKQDAIKESEMFQERSDLPNTLVIPTGIYKVGQHIASTDSRLHEGAYLLEYPFMNGKSVTDYLDNICDFVNPNAGAEQVGVKPNLFEMLHQTERKVETLKLVKSIAIALDALHNRGVVHQDINPPNILVDQNKEARVIDFGEAIYVGEKPKKAAGSPTYMPSEVLSGSYIGHPRIDVYGLGVTAARLLTGNTDLFGGRQLIKEVLQEQARERGVELKPDDITPEMLREDHLEEEQKIIFMAKFIERKREAKEIERLNPMSEQNLSKTIFKPSAETLVAIERACQEDPEKRFQGMGEFAAAIDLALRAEMESREKLQAAIKRQERSESRKLQKMEEESFVKSEEPPQQETPVSDPFFGVTRTYQRPQDSQLKEQPKAPDKKQTAKRRAEYWRMYGEGEQ